MTIQPLHQPDHDLLTRQALSTAAALLDAAARSDRLAMRRLLRSVAVEPGCTPDLGRIIKEVSIQTGLGVDALLGASTARAVVEARHVVSYVAHHYLGLAYAHIGRQLERDHTTIMSSCRRVEKTPRLLKAADEIARRLDAPIGSAPDIGSVSA